MWSAIPAPSPTVQPPCPQQLSHRVHVDGREQVLEHGGHELDVHALGAEAVEHQEGRVVKLLLVHPVSAQGRDHVPYQCILKGGRQRVKTTCVTRALPRQAGLSHLPFFTLLIWNVKVGPPGSRISFCQRKVG